MIYVTPAVRNYTHIAGNTFHESFTVLVDGTPLNLTGWKVRLKGGPINLSTDNGAIVLGGAAGTVNITASTGTTRAWGALVVDYQFEFEDEVGNVRTFYTGTFENKLEIA